MLFRRFLSVSSSVYLNIHINTTKLVQFKYNKNILCKFHKNYGSYTLRQNQLLHTKYLLELHRMCYSKRILDEDEDLINLHKTFQEKELKKISELFPQPRVILSELSQKTPDKIFDVFYKPNVVASKGRKKTAQFSDWTCTYAFVWPEKIKFEGTALTKRQAADKAALQALHYLYLKKRIDSKGHPVYNEEVLNDLRSTLNEQIHASISQNSVERIENIWNDYQSGIKEIYETTFAEAQQKAHLSPSVLTKDSTIDEEDEFSESDAEPDFEGVDISEQKVRVHPVYGRPVGPPSELMLQKRNKLLKQKFARYDEELTLLPIDQYTKEITSTLEMSRVAVIVGTAGCGKSTRVPAAVLRRCGAGTAAVVSEPRRVAAIGLAERVASELGENVGETIGFQVRLHSRPPRPPAGSILYCTSGVLLRRLQANPGLEGCTHVFIDEAHERDVNTDVTLLLLKRALDINPHLKVIVMSATLDTEVFTRYFDSCPVIEVPGRTFPVQVSYLDDLQNKLNLRLPQTAENCQKDGKPTVNCQEVFEVIKAVDKTGTEGAILVFLPGWAEIKQIKKLLDEHYSDAEGYIILPVHSRLSTEDQTKMFAKPPPGIRKVVLATNIAETSITIPDVVHVIDTGAHKENRIKDGTGIASLECVWVSQAGAKQRAGRAGRVQPGYCYRMYTKNKEEEFAPHTTPEILRIPLDQTALDCKIYAPEDKIEDFLSQLPEPPSKKAIQFAINDLIDLGALTPSERVTRVGVLVSQLTLPPRVSLSVLHGVAAAAVVPTVHAAVHAAAAVELFRDAGDRRDEIREIKRQYNATSDHAALHWIQEQFQDILESERWQGVNKWCDRNGLRKDRLNFVNSLSKLHLEQVLKCGMIEPTIEPDELNRFSDLDELTAGILLSGSNAVLRTKKHVRTKGKLKTVVELFTSTGDRAHIASESVNHGITKRSSKALLTYFGGYHSTERRALVVYRSSQISPHTALLFSMGKMTKDVNNDDTTILSLPKHKLQVYVPTSQADLLLKTREMLWNTFKYYIERDVKTLQYDDNTKVSRFRMRLIKTIGRILVEAEKENTEKSKDLG